jgi:hypothetical protein
MDHSTLFPLSKIYLTMSSITKVRVHIFLWSSISPQTLILHPIHMFQGESSCDQEGIRRHNNYLWPLVAFSQESFSSMCCPCICDTCHGHVRDVHTCEQIPHCTEGRAHHSTLYDLHQASQPQNRISCIKTILTYSATSFGNFIAFDYSVVLSSG